MVEPAYTEVRQALGRAFSLTCSLLRAHPARLLRYEWKLGERLLTVGELGERHHDTSYLVRALNREGYGKYTCEVTNEAGPGRCTFLVTGECHTVTLPSTAAHTSACCKIMNCPDCNNTVKITRISYMFGLSALANYLQLVP